MDDGRITYRDLYIQVRRMNLKHPHIFLTLALPHLSMSSIKAFGVSFFYVSCFICHYPRHTFAIIYAAGKVVAKNEYILPIYPGSYKKIKSNCGKMSIYGMT